MIEPQDAYTVIRRPVMPPKGPDTYREKLIARFGRVPSMAELAKLESATHRMSLDVYQPQTALEKSLDARRERTKETIGQLVAALTRPMTNQDLATATGIPLSTVAHLMLRALDEGAVKRESIQRVYIWERTDSPDKPPALPPIRGVVYATIAAAAKSLGVDAATVRRAFKRGTQDNIGLGRQPGFKGTPRWAKMNDDPTKPTLNSRGACDSADLARYFREAKSMGDAEIARHLGVEVHRIIFMRQRMKTP